MATVRCDSQGQILQFLTTEFAEQHNLTPPPGTAFTQRFDESTNQGVIDAYNANSAQFSMPGGRLTQTVMVNGSPISQEVAISPPSTYWAAVQELPATLAKLDGPDSLTTQEAHGLFRILFRDVRHV